MDETKTFALADFTSSAERINKINKSRGEAHDMLFLGLLSESTRNWVARNNRNVSSPSSGGQKPEIKATAGPHSLGNLRERILPCLFLASDGFKVLERRTFPLPFHGSSGWSEN